MCREDGLVRIWDAVGFRCIRSLNPLHSRGQRSLYPPPLRLPGDDEEEETPRIGDIASVPLTGAIRLSLPPHHTNQLRGERQGTTTIHALAVTEWRVVLSHGEGLVRSWNFAPQDQQLSTSCPMSDHS